MTYVHDEATDIVCPGCGGVSTCTVNTERRTDGTSSRSWRCKNGLSYGREDAGAPIFFAEKAESPEETP